MKKFLPALITLVMGVSVCSTPATATNGTTTFGVEAAILTDCAKAEDGSGNGAGVLCILQLVIDIMTIGVGILGVLGITIVGIQYLTAGGSEEKTRKAKRRMFEIMIGLLAYVVIYAVLKWLLPGFNGAIYNG